MFCQAKPIKIICTQDTDSDKIDVRQDSLINYIKQFINENYASRITINDIAEITHFNPTYLSFVFKRDTGQTIIDYVTQVRMDKAKVLLSDFRVKINDVCYSVGYQEPSYFSKLFKKYTGFTPKEYRCSVPKTW